MPRPTDHLTCRLLCSDNFFLLGTDDPPLTELRSNPLWNVYMPNVGMKPRHQHSIFGPRSHDGGCTIQCIVDGNRKNVPVPAWVGGFLKFKAMKYDRVARWCEDREEIEWDAYHFGAASHACAIIKEFLTELGGKFSGNWDAAAEELGDYLTPCIIRGAEGWDCTDWDAQYYNDAVGDGIPYSEGRESK